MLLDLLFGLLVFFGLACGLAWPLATRLALAPAEKLAATILLSLLGIFLFAWAVYVWALPLATLWTLPTLALAGLAVGARPFAALLRDADSSALLTAQLIVTLWGIGWLALVASYGGGDWVGDWYGHLQRTWFFLDHWPRHTPFNGFDPLTSRPPLANILTGALLILTRRDFAHNQLACTLLSSLAFLPAGLLARRFRLRASAGHGPMSHGRGAIAVVAVMLMLNPLWVENATYPWTKLPAAFFILTALYFFLRAHDADAPAAAGPLFAVSLTAGLLTHYSAGPYAVILAVAWLVFGRSRWRQRAWWRATALAALAGALVLATWFGWALSVYGVRQTFLTSTSVTNLAPTAAAQLDIVAGNLRDTLVPHFLRTADFGFFAQSNPWGWWRDWFFLLYQSNLFFAFGSAAGIVILGGLVCDGRRATGRERTFWAVFVVGAVVLGVGVHAGRDVWGRVSICLQPLVLLGLAWLAARWITLGPAWRRVLVAGATLDFVAGIALQAGAQSGALDRWFASDRPGVDLFLGYSQVTQVNFRAKLDHHWLFVGDRFAPHAAVVAAGLAALLLLALLRADRVIAAPSGSG